MDPAVQVICSMSLSFGVPLAIAVRELIMLRRGGGTRDRKLPEPTPVAPISSGSRPLPPCLIPQVPARPARTRELEPV